MQIVMSTINFIFNTFIFSWELKSNTSWTEMDFTLDLSRRGYSTCVAWYCKASACCDVFDVRMFFLDLMTCMKNLSTFHRVIKCPFSSTFMSSFFVTYVWRVLYLILHARFASLGQCIFKLPNCVVSMLLFRLYSNISLMLGCSLPIWSRKN